MFANYYQAFLAPCHTYSGILFLEEDLIILPNAKSAAFDFFRIPTKPIADTLKPILSLQLPSLADGMSIDYINCRAEPNPIPDISRLNMRQRAQERADIGMDEVDPFAPRRGFLASGEDAICIFPIHFGIVIQGVQPNPTGGSYTLFVHRSNFLKIARQYEETPNLAYCEGQAEAGVASDPRRIAWVDWGPPVSRWFNAITTSNRWITTSAGQRCAMIHDYAGTYGSPIKILDFNPLNIRKMKGEFEREEVAMADSAYGEDRSWPASDMEGPSSISWNTNNIFAGQVGDADSDDSMESADNSDGDRFTPSAYTTNSQDHRHPGLALCSVLEASSRISPGTFAEEVEGRLPYIEYVSEKEYNYDGVLLDEERMLGITVRLFTSIFVFADCCDRLTSFESFLPSIFFILADSQPLYYFVNN